MNNTNCTIDHQLDRNLFPVLYSLVFTISIPANSAALYIACCQIKKRNELGIYLFSLSLADLLFTLTLPLWIHYYWNNDNWTLSPGLCKFSAFFEHLNYYTSSGFLTCISIDRYLAVGHPLRFHCLRTRKCALLVSLLVWAFEITLNCQLIQQTETFNEKSSNPNHANHTFCFEMYPLQDWQAKFNLYRIFWGYAVPLATMVFCYLKIYQAVKHNQATEDTDKKKINHLLLGIIVTFFVCFTPYHIVLLIRSIFEHDSCFAQTMFKPYRITAALTSVNCIADPILYCFVSETGRADFCKVFKCGSPMSQTETQLQIITVSKNSQKRTINVPE
ncbi:psychosine receptor [Hemicordylus capensis]|uniref:psychosine receptor n=1 Tax=Hemicordylus capensis TaxID=884348 RepID=UPI0023034B19|nr:psychosine receptor [Hemicordylus capensis]